MKKTTFTLFVMFTILMFSCKKTEYIDNEPQLEITVLNINGEYISNADVTLYKTEGDWKNQSNQVTFSKTNTQGIVLFENLECNIYYFYAEKTDLNNSESIAVIEKELQNNIKAQITTIIK